MFNSHNGLSLCVASGIIHVITGSGALCSVDLINTPGKLFASQFGSSGCLALHGSFALAYLYKPLAIGALGLRNSIEVADPPSATLY